MLIETLPAVLTWNNGRDVLAKVHAEYVLHTSSRFGAALGQLFRDDRTHLAETVPLFESLSDDSKQRFITAPEVTWRLYWRTQHTDADRRDFIVRSLYAEALRARHLSSAPVPPPADKRPRGDLWTCVGDMCFREDGSLFESPMLRNELAVDFSSPFARTTDTGVPGGVPTEARPPMTEAEQASALGKLGLATDGIAASGTEIWDFVVAYTKALVVQPDPDMVEFASGSSGQFVGRSALWNVQSDGVDQVDVAEGLVHEAIHSLLYMQERLTPWVYKEDLYGPELRTTSPWTGNRLPLRPFLQACFVWYGLTNFWLAALRVGVFPREKVNERLSQALCGFAKGALLDNIESYLPDLAPDLLESVRELQDRVVAALDVMPASAGK